MATIYAQRNPSWANEKLGNSQSSFGDYGCLLCCFASMANDCDKTVTPPQLNELLKEKNLYVEGDLLNDWVIEDVYPDIKFLETKYYGDVYADLGYIREKLSEGKLLIAGIDFYPSTDAPDYHFVRIISSDDNGFKLMDPWYAEVNQYIYKYYGAAGRAILKVMVYEAPTSPPTNDALSECLRMHGELVTELEVVKKQLTEKDTLISTQAGTLLQKDLELIKARETARLLEEEVAKKEELRAKWYELYQQSQTNLNTCKKDSAFFQKQLTECQAKLDFTFWELLEKLWEKIKAHKFTGA